MIPRDVLGAVMQELTRRGVVARHVTEVPVPHVRAAVIGSNGVHASTWWMATIDAGLDALVCRAYAPVASLAGHRIPLIVGGERMTAVREVLGGINGMGLLPGSLWLDPRDGDVTLTWTIPIDGEPTPFPQAVIRATIDLVGIVDDIALVLRAVTAGKTGVPDALAQVRHPVVRRAAIVRRTLTGRGYGRRPVTHAKDGSSPPGPGDIVPSACALGGQVQDGVEWVRDGTPDRDEPRFRGVI